MSEREEVLLEHGFMLHERPFRNTSLLVECMTERHGRIGLIAQGIRRSPGGRRALMQPFLPLKLSWIRRGELGRLTHVEADHGGQRLGGEASLAGFYVNELLLRLVPRGEGNDDVFSCYSLCLRGLASRAGVARTLRLFELSLLGALGYSVVLDEDARTGDPLRPDLMYVFELESGPTVIGADTADETYSGKHLIALRERALDDPDSLRAARRLLGRILRSYLGDRPLKSRDVLREIVEGGFSQ